jgi:hypothetical protein
MKKYRLEIYFEAEDKDEEESIVRDIMASAVWNSIQIRKYKVKTKCKGWVTERDVIW